MLRQSTLLAWKNKTVSQSGSAKQTVQLAVTQSDDVNFRQTYQKVDTESSTFTLLFLVCTVHTKVWHALRNLCKC